MVQDLMFLSPDMLDIVTDTEGIMQFVYPDHILQDSTSCLTHAILESTNQQVDQYNVVIFQCIHGTQHVYLTVDTLKETNNAGLIITRVLWTMLHAKLLLAFPVKV